MIGLYIHIPFCDQKCAYCDFLSFPGRHSAQKAQYLDALCAEQRRLDNEIQQANWMTEIDL